MSFDSEQFLRDLEEVTQKHGAYLYTNELGSGGLWLRIKHNGRYEYRSSGNGGVSVKWLCEEENVTAVSGSTRKGTCDE